MSEFPEIFRIRQHFQRPIVEDIPSEYKSTDLDAADYILTYRVLECGISYRDFEDDEGTGFNFSDITFNQFLNKNP